MKPVSVAVRDFPRLNGWANRILYIDLSDMSTRVRETAHMVPDYLGGRGLAARVLWDEYPESVPPFDPASPLMVFAGALTGSHSASSGRAAICGFSPQGWPYPWFTRSNIGGRFGGELKRAGYDGLIVTGASDIPVRIRVVDDEVSVLPAEELWGKDALDTLEALEGMEGEGVRSLVIGPAGERLCHISTIQTASSSAAGHCGFGAVMGAKKLKAVTVAGSGQVALADEDRVMRITRAIGAQMRRGHSRNLGERVRKANERLEDEGLSGRVRAYSCTEACPAPCGLYYVGVPGCAYERGWSGHWFCVGGLLRGVRDSKGVDRRGVFDWRLGVQGGLEMNVLSNRYGLNQWDLIIGMVPWLEACQKAGLIDELNGEPMDWRSCDFWAHFLKAIAYREGIGDALALGGWGAAFELDLGVDLMRRFYTAWGHAGHWDGHADLSNHVVFPYWLVPALQWLTATRDPIPSGHGYAQRLMSISGLRDYDESTSEDHERWDKLAAIGERVYGSAEAVDPRSGYEDKALAGFLHAKRSVMKDCLPGDDYIFPMFYSHEADDLFARLDDLEGIDGPSLEYHLFKAGIGVDWSEEEFERAAERVYTLERANIVRHWGRTRELDELVLPSFEYPENWTNPAHGRRLSLDRDRFTPVMDEYYRLLGWDEERGWPTKERLEALGLTDIYKSMTEGACEAQTRLSPLPELGPVSEVLEEGESVTEPQA